MIFDFQSFSSVNNVFIDISIFLIFFLQCVSATALRQNDIPDETKFNNESDSLQFVGLATLSQIF